MPGRILLAGTHSSVGKTTVTLGLLVALRAQGLRPAPFKAGPDYIDPSLHAQAAGRPSRNLDPWLMDAPALLGALRRGLRGADIAVVEGVMGLFDGIGSGQEGSTAAVARALACPVLLVLDVSAMSGTAAALVLGCQQTRPGVALAGVILNRVGGEAHARATAEAIRLATGLPVLGTLPDDPALSLPERHLGLVPAAEGGAPHEVLEQLAHLVQRRFDLAAIQRLASMAPPLSETASPTPQSRPVRVRIGVAQDRAFGFTYQDTIDLLAESGAEVVPFSPLADTRLPDGLDGLYLGGGFPELYAAELSDNLAMGAALRAHVRAGRPLYAECGGLMALGRTLTTFDRTTLPMFGLLPFDSSMQRERLSVGYCEVEALRASPLLRRGERVRGHEFHWSEAAPPPARLAAYRVVGQSRLEGFQLGPILASYVHLNFAGAPHLLRRFVATCARRRQPAVAVEGRRAR